MDNVLSDQLQSKLIDQLDAAKQHKKLPLGKLITLFESTLPQHNEQRKFLCQHIQNHPDIFSKTATIVGLTGTPGAGKSTLVSALTASLLNQFSDLSIAVLAIDPSSQISGGSILGDRTRMRLGHREPRLFFRSQASNLELGGVTHSTFQACRILRHLFDLIIIETVGIGQNEIDIQFLTDHTYLVMQPLAGDQIQFMECGIMEIPDSFIVNKCDEDKLARTSYYMLRSALKQAKLIDLSAADDHTQAGKDQIFLTSAINGKGVDELANSLMALTQKKPFHTCEQFYLGKEIQKKYGEFGVDILESINNDSLLTNPLSTFEDKQQFVLSNINKRLL